MKNTAAACSKTWSIVLAGGDGERIRPFVEKWLGYHRPKQYCTFVGTRSMFQHTLDRADMLTPSERRVTVIARDHREEACSQLRGRASGKLILQPANRGTAAGIFLPLSYIQASDPDATVVVYPSDHFIYPEARLMEFVLQATDAVERFPARCRSLPTCQPAYLLFYQQCLHPAERRHQPTVPLPQHRKHLHGSSLPKKGLNIEHSSVSTPSWHGPRARAISRARGRSCGITSSIRRPRRNSSPTSPRVTRSRRRTRRGATTTR